MHYNPPPPFPPLTLLGVKCVRKIREWLLNRLNFPSVKLKVFGCASSHTRTVYRSLKGPASPEGRFFDNALRCTCSIN